MAGMNDSSPSNCLFYHSDIMKDVNAIDPNTGKVICAGVTDADSACAPACSDVLQTLRDKAGCCYAEVKVMIADLIDKTGSHMSDVLPLADAVWKKCDVPEPTDMCKDTVRRELIVVERVLNFSSTSRSWYADRTLRPHNFVQTPTSSTQKPGTPSSAPSGHHGGSDGQSGGSSKSGKGGIPLPVVIGAVGGAIALCAIIAGVVLWRRRRYSGPRYLSIKSDDTIATGSFEVPDWATDDDNDNDF